MLPIMVYMDGTHNAEWVRAFKAASPDIDVRSYESWGDDTNTPCYAFLWKPEHGLVAKYPNIKVIFYAGAGVDHLLADPTLPKDIPIARLSDDGLRDGMADWVVMNVLMQNRKMPQVMAQQRRKIWLKQPPKLPQDLNVGIMGYGALGKTCAERLRPFGYKLITWSRTAKEAETDVTHYTGAEEFKDFLGATDILVSLLPATTDTNDLLNAETIACLPKGASIINAGRGNVLDTAALLDAIERGHIAGASLDVFKTEPLPQDDPLWDCEKVIITPHISAETRIETAVDYVLGSIATYEATGEIVNLYERDRGY